MKFQCNIGKGGRLFRIIVGLILIVDAYLLYRFEAPGPGLLSTLFQLAIALFGAFCVFEGVVGWCAFRALGMRTKF